jgi:hypothetical protein
MITDEYRLTSPPDQPQRREIWLQHAASFILFEDVRRYARDRLDPSVDAATRATAERAIDDTLYGLMMVIDSVTGSLRNPQNRVELRVTARLVRRADGHAEPVEELDLADGDGMCMGYHEWIAGNFGKDPVAGPLHQDS